MSHAYDLSTWFSVRATIYILPGMVEQLFVQDVFSMVFGTEKFTVCASVRFAILTRFLLREDLHMLQRVIRLRCEMCAT